MMYLSLLRCLPLIAFLVDASPLSTHHQIANSTQPTNSRNDILSNNNKDVAYIIDLTVPGHSTGSYYNLTLNGTPKNDAESSVKNASVADGRLVSTRFRVGSSISTGPMAALLDLPALQPGKQYLAAVYLPRNVYLSQIFVSKAYHVDPKMIWPPRVHHTRTSSGAARFSISAIGEATQVEIDYDTYSRPGQSDNGLFELFELDSHNE